MKKFLIYIRLIIFIILITGSGISFAGNLGEGSALGNHSRNDFLEPDSNSFSIFSSNFITFTSGYGSEGITHTVVQIAWDLKNIFFVLASVYFIVIVLKLLFSSNTEEEVSKFKKGIIWITIGIIIMQLAYSFSVIIFGDSIDGTIASSLGNNIIMPLISLLETLVGVFFIAIAVYSFYKLITANGNEEAIKSGRMSIIYAIVGFIIIRFVRVLVGSMYGNISCSNGDNSCIGNVNLSSAANIVVTIINWINSFFAIVIVLMIIYAGFNILLSGGDEEKIKKGKNTIIYIIIGLFILSFNYIILTFLL